MAETPPSAQPPLKLLSGIPSLRRIRYSLIISLDGVPRQLAQWSKGCACHEKLQRHSPAAMRALMQLCYGPEGSSPLLGKRASELAGGCLDTLAESMVHESLLQSLEQYMARLTDEQVGLLMADGASAKAHFQLQLTVKLDHWKRLPWVLSGVSHWDPEVARASASAALAAMDTQNVLEAHAALTQ
eukprot:6481793-Amphidinium_carterae.2